MIADSDSFELCTSLRDKNHTGPFNMAQNNIESQAGIRDVNDEVMLKYLGLPGDYMPLPSKEPIEFLRRHLRQLPSGLLQTMSDFVNPKKRTIVPTIRNRRLMYIKSNPPAFSYDEARKSWPALWRGPTTTARPGQGEREDEKKWADSSFLEGTKQHVGKLGSLLGEFAEEREAEQARAFRRAAAQDFVPEEEEDSDNENMSDDGDQATVEETEQESKENFERLLQERFIYGLLDHADYDAVDWNDQWDTYNDRDDEDRWFDEEEEGE